MSVEIRGQDLDPAHFDVLSGLAYVNAYLELIVGLAEVNDERITFRGLRIEAGSVAFKVDVDQPAVARGLAREAADLIEGRRLAPRGLRTRVRNVNHALAKLPAGCSAHVRVGQYAVALTPPADDADAPRIEAIQLRVMVYRVGGKPPRVSVASDVEGGFTLSLREPLAERIANHLYREVDLVAMVRRAEDGRIVDGEALDFAAVEDSSPGDEADAWRRWFAVAGANWDEVDDIELELERGRGDGARGVHG